METCLLIGVESDMFLSICVSILSLKICWTWNISWQASLLILEFLHWNWDHTDRTYAFAPIFVFKFIHGHLHNTFMSLFIHDLLICGFTFILTENTSHKTFTLFKQKKTYLLPNKAILHHPLRNLTYFHHMQRQDNMINPS